MSPLHWAALARNPAAIRAVLAALGDAASVRKQLEAPSPCGSPLHLLARGPLGSWTSKRLQPALDAAAAVEACELLLAAYDDDARVAEVLLEKHDFRLTPDLGQITRRSPLHLAAEYCAPPALTLRLLAACPLAAAVSDDEPPSSGRPSHSATTSPGRTPTGSSRVTPKHV